MWHQTRWRTMLEQWWWPETWLARLLTTTRLTPVSPVYPSSQPVVSTPPTHTTVQHWGQAPLSRCPLLMLPPVSVMEESRDHSMVFLSTRIVLMNQKVNIHIWSIRRRGFCRWSCSAEESNLLGWHLPGRSLMLSSHNIVVGCWPDSSWWGSVLSHEVQVLLPDLHPGLRLQSCLAQESSENVLPNWSWCWRIWHHPVSTWHSIRTMCSRNYRALQSVWYDAGNFEILKNFEVSIVLMVWRSYSEASAFYILWILVRQVRGVRLYIM